MDKFYEFLFDTIVISISAFGVSVIVFVMVMAFKEVTCDRVNLHIVEIGSCSRHNCGVKYSDGSYGEESSPIIGKTYSVCKE
jgi:hypothetical protein